MPTKRGLEPTKPKNNPPPNLKLVKLVKEPFPSTIALVIPFGIFPVKEKISVIECVSPAFNLFSEIPLIYGKTLSNAPLLKLIY